MAERRVKQAVIEADYDGEPMFRCGNGSPLKFERRKALRTEYDTRSEAEDSAACARAWRIYYAEAIMAMRENKGAK